MGEQGYVDMLRGSAFSSSDEDTDDSDTDEEFNNSALGQLLREHREGLAASTAALTERLQLRPWDRLRDIFYGTRAFYLSPVALGSSLRARIIANADRTVNSQQDASSH